MGVGLRVLIDLESLYSPHRPWNPPAPDVVFGNSTAHGGRFLAYP